jgi:hypothetical protein
MLRIGFAIKDVVRPPNSPSVSFISLVAVVPGSSYNVVKVTPASDHFYIYLPAVDDKASPGNDHVCIFPAQTKENYAWAKEVDYCVDCCEIDGYKTIHCEKSILHIITYETVSDPTPMDTSGAQASASTEKPLGEWESYALKNNSSVNSLQKLGYETLGTVRVGQARVSIAELAKTAVAKGNQGGSSTVTLPLMDFTDNPQERGSVELTLEYVDHIDYPDSHLDTVNRVLQSPTTWEAVEACAKVTPLFTQAGYETLVHSAEKEVYVDYVEAYVKMFPPVRKNYSGGGTVTSQEFAATARSLGYTVSTDDIHIPTPLEASAPNITAMHAPVTSVDGDLFMPMGFYYKEPVAREFISDRHESYLGSIMDSICQHVGTKSETVARIVHDWLDTDAKGTVPDAAKYCTIEMLACIRIFGLFLTHLNTTFRYRADFSNGNPKQEGDAGVKIREDTSNDLIIGMNSEDCDGFDKAVQTVCFIVRTGMSGWYPDWVERDRLQGCLSSVARQFQGSFFMSDIGGWDHKGLDAFQRLLFYYTPLSLVGATTMAFPNDRSSSSMPQIRVKDLDYLQNESPEEVKKLHYTTAEMGQLECHRWSILLPFQTVIDSLVLCTSKEDASGVEREKGDQQTVDILTNLHQSLHKALPFPLLPPITLEGTVPTNPFALVGASAWLKPGSLETAQLRNLEAWNRRASMRNKNSTDDAVIKDSEWYERGVVPTDEGPCQWLPRDDPTRRCSLFYKMVTCCNIPFLDELFGGNELPVAL